MDKIYDLRHIFSKVRKAQKPLPKIQIEIKDTDDEFYFDSPWPLRKLSGGRLTKTNINDLFENKDSLGKGVVWYGKEREVFPDYNSFLKSKKIKSY